MRLISLRDEAILWFTGSALVLLLSWGTWNDLEPVYALDNGVKITNNYTGVITNHPIIIPRTFFPGEITNYPRPFATPSNTGTRAAVTTWQADVKTRHRDSTLARTITGAFAGSPSWQGGGGGLTSIVLTSGVAAVTFSSPPGLALGDRLVIEGTTANNPSIPDNVIINEVVSSTVFKYLSRGNLNGTFTQNTTFSGSGVRVTQKIDPMEPTSVCRYESVAHDLRLGETVTIASVGGITPSSATQIVTGITRNTFVTNATCSGTYTSGGTATGPAPGSVKFALIGLIGSIPSPGNTRYDFINSTNPSSAGDAAATAAAGFDKAAMLAATWNGDLVTTAAVKIGATAAYTTSPRTMLTGWNGTESECGSHYWMRGPAITWFILNYGCSGALAYDFGWKVRPGTTTTQAISTAGQVQFTVTTVANIDVGTELYFYKSANTVETMTVTNIDILTALCNGLSITIGTPCLTVTRATTGTAQTFPTSQSFGMKQWEDATDPYKSLHPSFQLKFSSGWAGVGVLVDVENEYMTKQQNLWYSADLQTGSSPASRIFKPTFKHTWAESWKLSTWDGTDPEFYNTNAGDPDSGTGTRKRKFLIDFNTPYMSYSKLIAEYKLYSGALQSNLQDNFAASGKGAILTTLDAGTYNRQPNANSSSADKSFAASQEAHLYPAWQAYCFLTWSDSCYEEVYGDSLPGGGGNIEAQKHIPWNFIEDDAAVRFVMPGFNTADDSCFGKSITLYCRPTWISSQASIIGTSVSTFDQFKTACSISAPATPPASGSTTDSAGTRGWSCFYYNSTGMDGWAADTGSAQTHHNDWQEFGYNTSGDPRHLKEMQLQASWIHGFEPGYRKMGRSWAQPDSNGTEERAQGSWVRNILNAAIYTPNVIPSGMAAVPVQSYYWEEKLWNLALAKEGLFNVTDGWMSILYPNTFITTSPSTATNTTASIWSHVRWISTLGNGVDNPLGMPIVSVTTCTTDHAYLNCPTYYGHGMWYMHHYWLQTERAERNGLLPFYYVRRVWGNTALSMFGSSNWNPFMNDLYVQPTRGPSGSHPFITTLANFYAGLKPTWSPTGPNGNFTRDNQTFFHDCGGLGKCDNATVPDGYVPQWRADLANMSDLSRGTRDGCSESGRTPLGCTWKHAWDWINQNAPLQNDWGTLNKVIIEPRATVRDLLCTPGGTTAICTYTAPSLDAGTYLVSTSTPTTTLDDTDTSDGGGVPNRRVVLTGLSPSTSYQFRLTIGQRVSGVATGTGRVVTTFTTTTEGGADTIPVQFPGVTGASTVTVEYGDDNTVAGGTLGPTSCASSCTFDVPGTVGKVVWYRPTYKTGGGATVAAGRAQSVMVP